MKKTLFACALFILLSPALLPEVLANDAKMIFWYPGEAGSTEEAQPVIDAFLDYLNENLASASISGKYFNTVEGGLGFIGSQKPKLGIISFAAWTENREKLGGAKVVLATLPLPQGKATEKYELVGTAKELPPGAKIYSSEPFTKAFVKDHLFADLPGDATLVQTDRIFLKLKDIAGGKENAFAILTPMEAATIRKLGSPWTKPIRYLSVSKPVSTARVVLFDQGWKEAQALTEILLSSSKDQAAADILEEMRLKGFAKTE